MALIAMLAACGGDDGEAGPRDITRDEANVLSRMLVANHDAGNARFTANVSTQAGATFVVDGVYDWDRHLGVATVTTDGDVEDLEWSLTDVATRPSGGDWMARPADPTRYPDLICAVITVLSAPQAENPQLLLQRDDVSHVREDELGGDAVDVFQLGQQRYWVAADGQLIRVETLIGEMDSAVVDLTDLGSADVPDPVAIVA
jgi:hypothetical protein